MDVWQVQMVAPSADEARKLAGSAVEAKLAAGAQLSGPVISVFWHHGEYGTGEEWQVLLKTTEAQYPALERHLVEHHEWTNPEITAAPFAAGLAPYLDWVRRTAG
ncbi:MAG: divalent-cation tolerance protein CutA [Sciscionella sp.]